MPFKISCFILLILFISCKPKVSTGLIAKTEKCLGIIKTKADFQRLKDEEKLLVYKCLLTNLSEVNNKIQSLSSEDRKSEEENLKSESQNSEYKEILLDLRYDNLVSITKKLEESLRKSSGIEDKKESVSDQKKDESLVEGENLAQQQNEKPETNVIDNIEDDYKYYTTTGLVQYQKLDGYNYVRTAMVPSGRCTWGVFRNNVIVAVIDGNKRFCEIKKRTRKGNLVYFEIEDPLQKHTILIDGKSVVTFIGDNEETQNIFKITKVENTTGYAERD